MGIRDSRKDNSVLHEIGLDPKGNLVPVEKWVHPDGREMAYSLENATPEVIGIERAGIMGSFNYVHMPDTSKSGV